MRTHLRSVASPGLSRFHPAPSVSVSAYRSPSDERLRQKHRECSASDESSLKATLPPASKGYRTPH